MSKFGFVHLNRSKLKHPWGPWVHDIIREDPFISLWLWLFILWPFDIFFFATIVDSHSSFFILFFRLHSSQYLDSWRRHCVVGDSTDFKTHIYQKFCQGGWTVVNFLPGEGLSSWTWPNEASLKTSFSVPRGAETPLPPLSPRFHRQLLAKLVTLLLLTLVYIRLKVLFVANQTLHDILTENDVTSLNIAPLKLPLLITRIE